MHVSDEELDKWIGLFTARWGYAPTQEDYEDVFGCHVECNNNTPVCPRCTNGCDFCLLTEVR